MNKFACVRDLCVCSHDDNDDSLLSRARSGAFEKPTCLVAAVAADAVLKALFDPISDIPH
jgi:hypothetical protein